MMGAWMFRCKTNFLGIFKNISSLYCCLVLFSLFNISLCLYEDQIGKFDWKESYVGKIKFSHFDTVSAAKKIIVATEENVIAALNLKTGQIIWRHVLESTSQGNIEMLHVGEDTVTVSGNNPSMIRGWDTTSGYLLWEWSLWLQGPAQALAPAGRWWVEGSLLHHLLPVTGSHLEFTSYNLRTGQNRGATSKLPAAWISNGCVLSAPYYTCITGQQPGEFSLISMDVTSNAIQLLTKSISSILPNLSGNIELKALRGSSPAVIVNGKVLQLKPDGIHISGVQLQGDVSSITMVNYMQHQIILQSHYSDESVHITATNLESGSSMVELSNSVPLSSANSPRIEAAVCSKTNKNVLACRILLGGVDDAVYLIHNPGRLIWTREESLARIVGVEMVDLPVSELEAVIETEFDSNEGDFVGMVFRRLKSQVAQIKTLIQSLLHILLPPREGEEGDAEKQSDLLVRDEFGLHKIIITATESGKVFAIDNLSGKIIWKRYIPFLSSFKNKVNGESHMLLYVQRTTRHLPFDAQCSIIGRNKLTGKGMLFMFNPITGAGMDLGIATLRCQIKQIHLLTHPNAEFLKGIVILDETNQVHVFPPSCKEQIESLYMFVADPVLATVQGYRIKRTEMSVKAVETYLIRLGGAASSGHRITNVAVKNPIERVHSQGKVMGDRSVLYKYINPNLVVFTTEGPDPVHKDVLNVFLVDVVSGGIIMVQSHRRARGPVKIVHSENWLVYTYYSDKSRRPELATLELFEGPNRSGDTAFSSLRAGWAPEAARQAFVIPAPAPPLALATTITDRGITSKDILLSLNTGSIVELPWVIVDPRRPTVPMTNEMREEGLIQYTPELPLPSEAVINYNQSLVNLRHTFTSPSGLESTCLVFAYGLDVFFTRVAPSKTFDLLKEDFDYFLIIIVLVALIVSSYAAKRFASRKALRQAWK